LWIYSSACKLKVKMNENIFPFEIYYHIYSFLHSCKDFFSFRCVCQMFFDGLPTLCKPGEPPEENQKEWLTTMYGPKSTDNYHFVHRCHKPTFISHKIINEGSSVFGIIGTSKKLFRFALDVISHRNYIGGAIFNTHEKLSPVLQNYSPPVSFLQIDQFSTYLGKLKNFSQNNNQEDNDNSFLILLKYHDPLIQSFDETTALFNGRHLMIDFIYQKDDVSGIVPTDTTQTDYFFLKKQSSTNMQMIFNFFDLLGINRPQTIELFDKTLQSNYVLLLSLNFYYPQFRSWGHWECELIDIGEHLSHSFLSDQHFWHHLNNMNPIITNNSS
jgi:hypothetical protein